MKIGHSRLSKTPNLKGIEAAYNIIELGSEDYIDTFFRVRQQQGGPVRPCGAEAARGVPSHAGALRPPLAHDVDHLRRHAPRDAGSVRPGLGLPALRQRQAA